MMSIHILSFEILSVDFLPGISDKKPFCINYFLHGQGYQVGIGIVYFGQFCKNYRIIPIFGQKAQLKYVM
jgi:hypothetical protein